MIYILGIKLNYNKKVFSELTCIYGVGIFQASLLCNFLNVGNNCYINQLTQTQINKLLKQIEKSNLTIENKLQKQKQILISELIGLKCYRGLRHSLNLPVRGQRTRTNARSKIRNRIKNV